PMASGEVSCRVSGEFGVGVMEMSGVLVSDRGKVFGEDPAGVESANGGFTLTGVGGQMAASMPSGLVKGWDSSRAIWRHPDHRSAAGLRPSGRRPVRRHVDPVNQRRAVREWR